MNRADMKTYLGYLAIAGAVYFLVQLVLAIAEIHLSAQNWAAPNDGNGIFALMIAINVLFLLARVSMGYLLLAKRDWPIWIKSVVAFLVCLSGGIGIALGVLYLALQVMEFRNSATET